jgi:aryl-alcohol dehydrogenase-like predicted oxidoreductase
MQETGAMEWRPLGTSGLRGTRIGLGLAALGRPGYITLGHGADLGRDRSRAALEGHTHRMLDSAVALGVGYVDAARSYGAAERILAAWLDARGARPGDVTVASKWGYVYTADWAVDADVHEVKDHSAAALTRQHAESRAALGAHLALYQVHSATLDSGILDDVRTLDALARLRDDDGLVIGLTTSGPHQAQVIDRAVAIERGGARLFCTVQSTWNVLEPSAGPALARAHEAGMGVIIKEGVANGRPTDRNPGLRPGVRERLMAAVPGAESLDQASLALVLAQPFVDIVLSGAATEGQLRSNVRAAVLADGADRPAGKGLAETPAAYWAARAGLPWN